MTTPVNLLSTQASWDDVLSISPYNSNDPTTLYDSANSRYEFTQGGEASIIGIRFNSTVNAGDKVSFNVVAPTVTGVTVSVYLNTYIDGSGYLQYGGSADFVQVLSPGQSYTYNSAALSAGEVPYIEVSGLVSGTSSPGVQFTALPYSNIPSISFIVNGFGLSITDALLLIPSGDNNVLSNGETLDHIEFNYGDDATWSRGINDNAPNSTGYASQFYGTHVYAAGGTYTVTARVYTVEAGATPYEYTGTFTANAGETPVEFTVTADTGAGNNLAVNFTDTTAYYTGAGNAPAGQIKFVDRAWYIYDAATGANVAYVPSGDPDTDINHTVTPYVFAQAGTYLVQLYLDVTDENGTTYQYLDEQTVTIPVVTTAAAFTDSVTGLDVVFTDTSTFAQGVTALSYNWDFGDGNGTSNVQSPTYTYAAAGTYTVTMHLVTTEADASNLQVSHTVTVAPLTAPTQPEFTTNVDGLTVAFTDTTTLDPSVTATSYLWDFGDGQTSTVHNPTHVFGTGGTYPVKLTVGDSTGASTTVEHSLTVAPTVAATAPAFTVSGSGASYGFADTTTTDITVTIASYHWDFGDGQISTVQNPAHIYAASGSYTVTLTVIDSTGASTSTTRTVVATVTNTSDTYSLKGFVGFGALVDNTSEEVATLGELSVRSQTFAKDRALYSTAAGAGQTASTVDLTVFSSKQANGSVAAIPVDYSTEILAIGKWVYEQAVAGQFSADNNGFLQALLTEFDSVIKDVSAGTMKQQGALWMPEYVVFHFSAASADQASYTSISRVKLWFSDHSFATQYDEYLIEFVNPLLEDTALDDFFKPSTQVKNELAAVTMPQLMTKIQAVIGQDPPTLVKTINFDYHDPNDASFTLPTNWTFVIYGEAGDNIDAIKARLVEHILANSTHSQEDWAKVFPDIFTSTEFIIAPLWNQFAIPNAQLEEGIYSPIVNLVKMQAMAPSVFVGSKYTSDHIAANTSAMGVPYKSMALLVCGGPENREGISQIEHQWPDYIAVPTSSLDYDRMSPDTQDWVSVLYQLLKIAEDMTEFSDVPLGFTRLKRTNPNGQDVLYVVANFQDVQYLVVAKSWLNAVFPPPAPLSIALPSSSTITGPANGGAMSVAFTAAGGLTPYEYLLMSADSRLTNVSLNSVTGVFSATLPTWGNYPITIKVVDRTGEAVTQSFTLASAGT